jgi:hypothetical protein
MLPWRESERGVLIAIRALGGSAALRIEAHENKRSTAREVLLEPEFCAE